MATLQTSKLGRRPITSLVASFLIKKNWYKSSRDSKQVLKELNIFQIHSKLGTQRITRLNPPIEGTRIIL